MGTVFKAQDTHTNTWVAVKRLKADLLGEHSTDIIERFNREGEALRRLNHPNIVTVYDYGEAGGTFWLLMEYIDGVNLRQTLRAGRLSPVEALRYG